MLSRGLLGSARIGLEGKTQMVMSRRLLGCVLLLAMASPGAARQMKEADRLRAEAEHLCYDDVQRLCGEFIPDEAPITACMGRRRVELSPSCRKVFDDGLKKAL